MRAVFLDRDGVLNQSIVRDGRIYPPESAKDVIIAPRAAELLDELKQAGFLLIVVTNQPDVPRGVTNAAVVEEIHSLMRDRLPLDDVFVCFHDDPDGCDCRKPKPGMLLDAAA
ncbi:MAG: HAD-IIIA family hydrolase, partial [bacterium]|nr:HAD-IIIA family hydrolase [bacterium]